MTGKRIERRLARGEYVLANPAVRQPAPMTTYGQLLFLDTVAIVAPHVVTEFHHSVAPLFDTVASTALDLVWEDGAVIDCGFDLDREGDDGAERIKVQNLRRLTQAYQGWARSYNLDTEWVRETILCFLTATAQNAEQRPKDRLHHFRRVDHPQTGSTAYVEPGNEAEIDWYDCTDWIIGPDQRRFTFSHEGWNPLQTTWRALRDELNEKFHVAMGEYEARLRDLAAARGMVETPVKRELEAHMKWLVQFHVLGAMYADVAQVATDSNRDGNKSPGIDTITKAVASTAQLINLPLRK